MKEYSKLKDDLKKLIAHGSLLYYAMADEQNLLDKSSKDTLTKDGNKLPKFSHEYDEWYSEALMLVKQIIPERYNDFIKLYKDEKRKEISHLTYGIYDYLLGLQTTRGGHVIAQQNAAIPKMEHQNAILASAKKRFESSLFDIKEVLQAEVYDSELEAAKDLNKKGFVRAGGVVAGVILEKHLKHVCEQHQIKMKKKKPTLLDFYEALKEKEIIDTAKWRFIQHLGDLRNLCSHPKDREPTQKDVSELVEGTEKIIKTVF